MMCFFELHIAQHRGLSNEEEAGIAINKHD
jgi:hypothetical protein